MGDVLSGRRMGLGAGRQALLAGVLAVALIGGACGVSSAEGMVHVSGVVRDAVRAPVAGARAILNTEGIVEGTTAADGSYALTVVPGITRFYVETGISSQTGLPETWEFVSDFLDLQEDRTIDVALPPAVSLTVRVVGADGSPIAGADVRLPFYRREHVDLGGATGWVETFSLERDRELRAQTDATGEARFTVFDGSTPWRDGDGIVTPPEGSGYAPRSFPAPNMRGDTTYVVRYGSLDATTPMVSCDPPPPGWHTEEVSVACTAGDADSGLANPADASFDLTTAVGDGHATAEAQTAVHLVCDGAGNCVTAGPVGPIMVDRAAPEILFNQATDGNDGSWWMHTPVSIEAIADDVNGVTSMRCALDGATQRLRFISEPHQLAAPITVRGEGRHRVTCTASDGFGHTGPGSAFVLIDLNAPRAPLLAADRVPDYSGNGGWYADAVTVTTSDDGDPLLADGSPGSGVDAASVPSPQTFATSGSHAVSATVADVAGHLSATSRLTVKVDADPPATTLGCPAGDVRAGARASARWRDRDGESGLATAANGTMALSTSLPGAYTVQHTAVDDVGHTAASSCVYRVV